MIKNYRIKEFLLADILAGLTVGIMHIPQGMAYALLATLPPIYGLYTSFYPVLIYWIFGTSKHISIGTFAVISLMVASVISDLEPKYAPPVGFNRTLYELNIRNNVSVGYDATHFLSDNREKARVMIVMANTFCVGMIQLLMFVFQLGFLTSYLSEPFVNSFLAGCAVHVFTSQMKFVFGIKLTSYVGIFKIPKVTHNSYFKSTKNFTL
jgi:MFS superfamily sulfate permease-like transporter